jgi:hypothetical protein
LLKWAYRQQQRVWFGESWRGSFRQARHAIAEVYPLIKTIFRAR